CFIVKPFVQAVDDSHPLTTPSLLMTVTVNPSICRQRLTDPSFDRCSTPTPAVRCSFNLKAILRLSSKS
ncbi:hypothetical protein, partial [Coprococcus eutactus]|uniref:hypothetical protein n=1 Tax=Coprococcus eutactus TaxID=33043 RepID=UPI00210B4467